MPMEDDVPMIVKEGVGIVKGNGGSMPIA